MVPLAPALDVGTSALALAAIGGLFALRVVGQLLVVLREPGWLPPMEQWYSGVLAYPALLASQIAILAVMAVIVLGLGAGAGWAIGPYPELGTVLVIVAYVYAAAMGVRYVVRMVRRPDQRWLGGCIPIVFHVVLASWLLVLGSLWRAA